MGKAASHTQAATGKREAERKKAAASRQWMYMDGKGECVVMEVEKHVIMHRFLIHARDLRILDPLLHYPSTILGRERAIVLNLEHVKAIITAEEVLLRNPSDGNVIPIVEELCRRLPPKNNANLASGDHAEKPGMEPPKYRRLSKSRHDNVDGPPFEFRALEVALEAVCSFLDARTTELEAAAHPALEALISKLREHIDHTEDYINFELDKHRNQLIQMELVLNSATVVLSVFAAVAGIFGMNIPYTWMYGHDYVFKWVVLLTTIFCTTIFGSFMVYARCRGLIGT